MHDVAGAGGRSDVDPSAFARKNCARFQVRVNDGRRRLGYRPTSVYEYSSARRLDLRAGVVLRMPLQDDDAVRGVGVARADQCRFSFPAFPVIAFDPVTMDCLKGGCRDRPKQFHQMRASLCAAEQFSGLLGPAALYRQSFETLEIRCDVAANGVGAPHASRFDVDDIEIDVHREPEPHFMNWLTGPDVTTIHVMEIDTLDIDECAFNIVQTIVAPETLASYFAGV